MNLYIWYRAKDATWRHHNEAGVVIIALNLANARFMFEQWQTIRRCHNDQCDVYTAEPDEAIPIAPREHKVLVFADAGCC